MSKRNLAVPAILGLIAAFVLASAADAGKRGRNVVVKDSTDRGGKFYEPETYKRCDIKEVKATVKRGALQVKVKHRGKQFLPGTKQTWGNSYLNINTRGGKTSSPEYQLNGDGWLWDYRKEKSTPDAAKVKFKDGNKSLQWKLPLRKIGRPSKTGFQAQTCGEGAVDIAPGGNYFDDTSFDGTVDHKYKNIKTGR